MVRTFPMNTLRFGICALALALPACGALPTYYEDSPAPPPPERVEGYDPQLYDGYVVYYDDVGRPYHYYGGNVVWIQPEWPGYWGYVHHYRAYGPAYHRWYQSRGPQYRSYRAGSGHRR
jgi:hypothetical protein